MFIRNLEWNLPFIAKAYCQQVTQGTEICFEIFLNETQDILVSCNHEDLKGNICSLFEFFEILNKSDFLKKIKEWSTDNVPIETKLSLLQKSSQSFFEKGNDFKFFIQTKEAVEVRPFSHQENLGKNFVHNQQPSVLIYEVPNPEIDFPVNVGLLNNVPVQPVVQGQIQPENKRKKEEEENTEQQKKSKTLSQATYFFSGNQEKKEEKKGEESPTNDRSPNNGF